MKKFKIWFKEFFSGGPKLKPYIPNQPPREINETQVLIERIIMAALLIYFIFLF